MQDACQKIGVPSFQALSRTGARRPRGGVKSTDSFAGLGPKTVRFSDVCGTHTTQNPYLLRGNPRCCRAFNSFDQGTEVIMPGGAYWKGYLKLSLVTCPVAMRPATTEREKVRFHNVHRQTGNRVESLYVDAETGRPVERDDQVHGYEVGADQYVMLEDEELDAVALDSTHTIEIETFVPDDSVEWVWYDRPHYLQPNDPVGEEAFAVIRDAMAATGTVGISRLVLYRRERAVLLKPRGKGIVLWTLRPGNEVRAAEDYFGEATDEKPSADMLSLVKRLIGERTRGWDPSLVADPVQDRLLAIIKAKRKGKRPPKAKKAAESKPDNVVSIMDALKKSLAEEKKKK